MIPAIAVEATANVEAHPATAAIARAARDGNEEAVAVTTTAIAQNRLAEEVIATEAALENQETGERTTTIEMTDHVVMHHEDPEEAQRLQVAHEDQTYHHAGALENHRLALVVLSP